MREIYIVWMSLRTGSKFKKRTGSYCFVRAFVFVCISLCFVKQNRMLRINELEPYRVCACCCVDMWERAINI